MTAPPSLRAQKHAVPRAFDRVAARYDLLTGLNPGYQRHLARSAERLLAALRPVTPAPLRAPPPAASPTAAPTPAPAPLRPAGEPALLDLCCGTGLSTLALVRACPRATLTGLDASSAMLELARRKRELAGVRLVLGDAMDPAAHGAGGPYDGIFVAYGIRNLPDPDLCLRRLLALLRPGGVVCFHEYSVRDSLRAHLVWNAVCLGVIIPAGLVTTPRSDIYRYLRRSVNAFDGVTAFQERLRRAGFCDTSAAPMDGWQAGIVHTFLARRPPAT